MVPHRHPGAVQRSQTRAVGVGLAAQSLRVRQQFLGELPALARQVREQLAERRPQHAIGRKREPTVRVTAGEDERVQNFPFGAVGHGFLPSFDAFVHPSVQGARQLRFDESDQKVPVTPLQ